MSTQSGDGPRNDDPRFGERTPDPLTPVIGTSAPDPEADAAAMTPSGGGPLVSNNIDSNRDFVAPRELDYGPDITRAKPLDVPGRRGGFIISLVALLLFGFPPVCLLLAFASGILSVRALRMIPRGSEGRWMPITAIVIGLACAVWSAGYILFALAGAG